jgi:hypothetical protein
MTLSIILHTRLLRDSYRIFMHTSRSFNIAKFNDDDAIRCDSFPTRNYHAIFPIFFLRLCVNDSDLDWRGGKKLEVNDFGR